MERHVNTKNEFDDNINENKVATIIRKNDHPAKHEILGGSTSFRLLLTASSG
mgnify:CR=1